MPLWLYECMLEHKYASMLIYMYVSMTVCLGIRMSVCNYILMPIYHHGGLEGNTFLSYTYNIILVHKPYLAFPYYETQPDGTTLTFSLQSYGAADKLKEPRLAAPMRKKVFRQPSTDTKYLGIPKNFPTHFFVYCPNWLCRT